MIPYFKLRYVFAAIVLLFLGIFCVKNVCLAQQDTVGTLPIVNHPHHNLAVAQDEIQVDTWTWGGGITHTVSTTRHDNESVDTWTKRHKAAVMVAISYFPPDHPQQLVGGGNGIRIAGNEMIGTWRWLPEGTSIPIQHSLIVDRGQNESVSEWQKIFRRDLVISLLVFPRV